MDTENVDAICTSALPWQRQVWQRLSSAVLNGTLPHAILLAGEQGVGKRHFASALMNLLLCEVRAGEACGSCRACSLAQAGSHPDSLWIVPEEGARQIKIDQIRLAGEVFTRTAQMGANRVFLIEPAHLMTVAAANSLLKSLEEPGADSFFILVSDRPSMIPATVRSRCQQWQLPTPALEVAIDWVEEQVDSREEAQDLCRLVGPRPLLALASADKQANPAPHLLPALVEQIASGHLAPIDAAAACREIPLLSVIDALTRELHARVSLSLDRGEHASSLRAVLGLQHELAQTYRLLSTGGNPNAALTLDLAFIRLQRVLGT